MRIAIFSDVFYPELSGISDSLISLTKELAAMGHEIRFYVPEYSAKNYAFAGLPPAELDIGSNISFKRLFSVPYPTGTKQGRLVIPFPLFLFDIKKFNPDIIHTQLFFGAGIGALLAGAFLKKPVIGTNHTAIKEFVKFSPLRGKWVSSLALRYVNWYYGKCGLITAPSRSVIDEMRFYGFKKESRIISNPVDTGTFTPIGNKKRLKKKFGLGNYVVIHAGRLSRERKINVIIDAARRVKKQFPAAELAIAGRGVAENELKSQAEKLGIKSSVKFLGFLDQRTLSDAYNASEIFAITSTSDTQSMVMMQAMASGLPVIGVKSRALPEYINKKNGILIEPDDAGALAKKILFLFKNPEKRKELGAGARKFSLHFSSKSIAKSWEKIYENGIKGYYLRNTK